MPYALGVDLGTTFSAAAIERDGRVEVVSLGNHATTIPSMVFLRDGDDPLIGDAAERRGTQEPARLARVFKRRFGDSTPIVLDGTPVSADRLTSIVLRRIVTEVATRLGGQPDVIGVAHPANWGPFKIDLLRQAVQLAGVREATFVSEPVAAAMQYASTDRVEVGDVVAVYDLGGGTFDAAVLRKTPTGFETLGQPEGIERLGGIDFDHAVLAHVRRTIGTALEQLDPNDPAARSAVARLSEECIRGKEALSVDSETTIPVMLPNLQTQVRLTRVEFEDMIRPTLRETVESLQRAIRVSGVELNNVTAVLLAGGSSRIPLISEMLRSELGRPIVTDMHPKHAVAMGAARVAAQQRSAATAPRANAVPPPPVTAPAAPTTTPSPPPPPTPPPPPAPPPPAPVAQSPVTPARSGKGKVVAIAAAVVLAAGGGVFALTRSGSDGGGASPTSTAGVTAPATHEASTTQPAVTEPVATSSPTTVAPTQPTAVSTDPTTTGTPEGILLSADLSGCCSLPDGYTPVPYEQFDVSGLYATPDLGPTITGFYAGRSQIVATGDFPDIFVLTTDTELAGAALDQFLVWQGTDQGVDVFTPEGVPAKQHLSAGDGQSDCVTAHGGFVAISVCTFPGIDGLGVLDAFNDANRDLAIRWASDLSVLPAPAGFAWNPFITFDVTFLYGEPDVGHLIDYYGAGTVSDNGGATTIGINLMQTSEGLNDVELNQYLDWEGTAAGADVVTPGGLTAQQQLLAYEDTDCVTAYNDTDFVTVCTPAGVDGLPFADALYDALVAQRQD